MTGQKFIFNPVDNEMEVAPGHENDPKTVTEKLLEEGFKKKPVTNAELGIKPQNSTTGAQYVPKEQRLYENLKVPGYETPEKSNASYKKLKEEGKATTKKLINQTQREKDKPVTYEDWRLDTPRYKKHLADIIADDQTNIRYNPTTGTWQDKWGDKKTAQEALSEQQKIEKGYNEIFPPNEQKKYEQSLLTPVEKKRIEFQKKKMENLNKLNLKQQIKNSPIGTIKNLDKQKPNSWNDFKDGKITQVVKEKSPSNWEVFKQASKTPQEIAEIRKIVNDDYKRHGLKYIEPEDHKYLRVNGKMPGEEKKTETPINTALINELEVLAQQRLENQILEKKFHEVMQSQTRDPDLDRGLASVDGVEKFKKVVDLADSKWRNKKRTNYGLNTILGEPK